MSTPEGLVKAKIRLILRNYSVDYEHIPQNGYGKKGAPDYIAGPGGWYMKIEAKSIKNKNGQSELQKENERICKEKGGIYIVVDENNLEWFEELISNLVDNRKKFEELVNNLTNNRRT